MRLCAVIAILALGATSLPAPAAEPPQGAQFEGMWEVQRRQRRPPARPGQRGPARRPIGVEADEKGLTHGDYVIRRMMTEAGMEAFDRFDPNDLPANNCVSPGLPSIAMVPTLQEWQLDGKALRITHEHYSTKRSVHLDAEPPVDPEKTHLGHATGHFEGETLVIETTALTATLGGLSRNAPSSDARVVTERYRVLPGGDAMEGQITIEDEKFLTRAVQLGLRLRRPEAGTRLVLFPCDPVAARRHLDP